MSFALVGFIKAGFKQVTIKNEQHGGWAFDEDTRVGRIKDVYTVR